MGKVFNCMQLQNEGFSCQTQPKKDDCEHSQHVIKITHTFTIGLKIKMVLRKMLVPSKVMHRHC